MNFINKVDELNAGVVESEVDTPRAGIVDFLAKAVLTKLPKTESGKVDAEELAFQMGAKLLEMGRSGGRDMTGFGEKEIFANTLVRGLSTLVPALTQYSRDLKRDKETREDGTTLGILLGLLNGAEMPEKMSSWLSANVSKPKSKSKE